MGKKNRIVNNDPSINFRLPKELKQKINREAGLNNLTVSNYVRNLLESYYDGELFEEEIFEYRRHEFIKSIEFLRLVVWMYSKRNDKKCTSSNDKLDGYIRTLKNAQDHLPTKIVEEFDKVLQDVLRVKTIKSDYFKQFEFTKANDDLKKFNFLVFEEYIFNILQNLEQTKDFIIV